MNIAIAPVVSDLAIHVVPTQAARAIAAVAVARQTDRLIQAMQAQIEHQAREMAARDRRIVELEQQLAVLTEEEAHG